MTSPFRHKGRTTETIRTLNYETYY